MQGEGLDRRELLRLAGLLGVLLLVTGAIVLFTQGDGSAGEQPAALEGTISSVRADGFTLRPADGGPERELGVLPQDAAVVDLPHLQEHVTDQLPVRVLIREERGVTYAREVIDLAPSG